MVSKIILVIVPIVALIATGTVVLLYFPNLFLPDRLQVDEDTTTQELFESYNKLIQGYISGKDFEGLDIPIQEQIIEEINQLNEELAMDLNMTQVDPNIAIVLNEDAISEPCTVNCQTSPEDVNLCADEGAGFVFDVNLGCISEPIAEIIKEIELTFDPLLPPATTFDVLTTITLIDSSGDEFPQMAEFNVPLQSLITRQGKLLDLATVKVRLTGTSDSSNPVKTQGTLNFKINDASVRGLQVVVSAIPNPITSAFDIKINNRLEETFSFQGISGLQSGVFANKFEITLRDFKVEQGNVTFVKFGEISLYSLDFTFDKGLKTVVGSTGNALAIPISDNEIELCAQVRNYKPADVAYTFIPDKPSSVIVRIQTGTEVDMNPNSQTFNRLIPVYQNIVPSFTVNLDSVSGGGGLRDFCETRNAIPRSSDIQIVVTGIDFGTGTGNEIEKPAQIFNIRTPETKKDYFITCVSGDVDFVVHWCNSNFNYGHGRDSTQFIVAP